MYTLYISVTLLNKQCQWTGFRISNKNTSQFTLWTAWIT